MPLGRTTRKNILDVMFGKASITGAPAAAGEFWITLHTASPGVDGQTSNEVGGSLGYTAQETDTADWDAATSGDPCVLTNNVAFLFGPASGEGFGTVTHYGFWNHATNRDAANFLGAEALTGGSETIPAGDSLNFPAGSLTFSL